MEMSMPNRAKPLQLSERSWEFALIDPPRARTAADLPGIVDGLVNWLDIAVRLVGGRHKTLLEALLSDVQAALITVHEAMARGTMPKCTHNPSDKTLRDLRSLLGTLDMDQVEGSEASLLLDCALRLAEVR
jgi:hypothetical protein